MYIYRLIDWLMILPDNLTKEFTENLIGYEEEKKMPYITSAERIGIEKGIEKGMLSEAREMVIEALDLRFWKGNIFGQANSLALITFEKFSLHTTPYHNS